MPAEAESQPTCRVRPVRNGGGVTEVREPGSTPRRRVQHRPPAEPPAVLLPRTLRAALATRELPDWLRRNAGLPVGACVNDLRREAVRPGFAVGAARLRVAFCRLLDEAWPELRDARVLDRPWPANLDPRSVDWPIRVRCGLVSSGLIDDREWLAEVTYGRLVVLAGIGTRSAFDFAVTAQSAIDRAYNGIESPPELVELAHQAAESEWASRVSGQDPRFHDLLGADKRTFADRLNAARGAGSSAADDWFGLAWALPAVIERVERIDRSPLDLALRQYVEALHGLDGASLEALLARLGLDGQPPRPMNTAARDSGLSRERLRQLQVRLLARRPTHTVHMPALGRALELLVAAAPCPVEEGADLLHRRGIVTVSFRPESVLKAAELCRHEAGFQLEQTPRGARISVDPTPPYAGLLVRLVSLRSASFGVASLAGLVEALRAKGIEVSDSRARDLLEHHAEAEFLDEDWLWLPHGTKNRLVTLTHRMLAATSPLEVETLRGGILQSHPDSDAIFVPPARVLSRLYQAHPEFRIDRRGRVRAAPHAADGNVLTSSERILLKVFEAAPRSVLDRASLRDACVAEGMKENTFRVLLGRTPLLESDVHNRWRLRGAGSG
jgi:hypothetical protein